MDGIVVGVDMSQSARAAVTWAVGQARATGQALQAVPAIDGSPPLSRTLGMSGVPDRYRLLRSMPVREAAAAVFDSIQPEPDWQLKFFSGDAGPALVAESVGAALLVVGTKDHVGIGRLVSVSHYCVSHAQYPVISVPAAPDLPRARIVIMQQPTPRLRAERDHELSTGRG
jgi:nucleotide-binding universal stress UspA family protein